MLAFPILAVVQRSYLSVILCDFIRPVRTEANIAECIKKTITQKMLLYFQDSNMVDQ